MRRRESNEGKMRDERRKRQLMEKELNQNERRK